jgi:hypothetical protein
MQRRLKDGLGEDTPHTAQEGWEDLLHPAQAFEHPSHVVNDPDLTLNEKRANSSFVGIRCLRAAGSVASALRTRREATGSVRRRDRRSAHAGQAGQRNGQRALSAPVA